MANASMEMEMEMDEKELLEINWTLGWHGKMGLMNISKTETKPNEVMAFFVSAHFGILYEYNLADESKKMSFLKGHLNFISCFDVNSDGRWLVTVDKGDDSKLIVWNTVDRTPIYTSLSSLKIGTVTILKFSVDSKYLMTVSISTDDVDEQLQTVNLWDFTLGLKEPVCSTKIEKRYSRIIHVACSFDHPHFYCFTTKNCVFFMTLVENDNTLMVSVPRNVPKLMNNEYTQSAYLTDVRQVVTASTKGAIIIWDDIDYGQKKLNTNSPITNDKQYLKTFQLDEHPITVIICSKNNVITGNTNGNIFIYDKSLIHMRQLLICIGSPITSISMLNPDTFVDEANDKLQIQTNVKSKPVKVKTTRPRKSVIGSYQDVEFDPFLISTRDAKIFVVDKAGKNCVQIFDKFEEKAITAMAVAPYSKSLIVGTASGNLSVYNYQTTMLLASNNDCDKFENNCSITCIKYSDDGCLLCYGRENGSLSFVNPISLQPEIDEPFESKKSPIRHIAFSKSSRYVAYTNDLLGVYLFGILPTKKLSVKYHGGVECHTKTIRGIFLEEHDTELSIYSVGADRRLFVIDLVTAQDGHSQYNLVKRMTTEPKNEPLCMIRLDNDERNDVKFMISGSDFYLTTWNDSRCIGTNNVANLKSPITILKHFQSSDKNDYLLFCNDTDIGYLQLPFDGNPNKTSAVFCSGAKLIDFGFANHRQTMFSISKNCTSMLMWTITLKKILPAVRRTKLNAYSCLLDCGENGEEIRILKKFFNVIQLLHSERPETVVFVDYVDVSQIFFIMAAMGYFPSKNEVSTMMYEMLGRSEREIGHSNKLVTFEELVVLYLNNKPRLTTKFDEFGKMFEAMVLNDSFGGKTGGARETLTREGIVYLVTSLGENINYREMEVHFRTLMRTLDGLQPESTIDTLIDALPPTMTIRDFITDYFGFGNFK